MFQYLHEYWMIDTIGLNGLVMSWIEVQTGTRRAPPISTHVACIQTRVFLNPLHEIDWICIIFFY
jgi:hypothetical protein